jgi:hypothetical protein
VDSLPDLPAPPPTLRALWKRHGPVIAPPLWFASTEVIALALPLLAASSYTRAAFTAVVALVVGVYTLIRTRTRSDRITRRAGVAWWLGTPWLLISVLWAPHGMWLWVLQCPFVALGLSMAGRHMYENRYVPPLPVPEPEPEDARLVTFRDVICGPGGDLDGGVIEAFTPIKGGFRVDVELTLTKATTTALITGSIRAAIAKPYDVPADAVSIEYQPSKRSEARVRFTIITSTAMEDRPVRWDGRSTYDPATGTVELGFFMDAKPAHWALHRWRSGAAHGLLAGVTDSGKTTTAHRLICEIGLAKLCACGKRGDCTCEKPDLRRIANFWLGDPQRQPFSVWRGRAPVIAWGPEACLELLRATVRLGRLRAAFLGTIEWWDAGPDGQARKNTGKGWFDPEPGLPLHFTVIDEIPLLTGPSADPDLAKEATELLAEIGMQFRKTGVGVVTMSPMPDLKYLNDRAIREMLTAFNAIAHRCDALSTNMLGIEGNPMMLNKGVPGIGFINGPDARPGTKFRTGYVPEYADEWDKGVDVRHLAEQIASDPIELDQAYKQVLEEYGWTEPGIILDSDELVAKWDAEDAMTAAQQAGRAMDPLRNLAALITAGVVKPNPDDPAGTQALMEAWRQERGLTPADPDAMATVLVALTEAGAAEIYDLMEATGLSARDVMRALDALESTGQVAKGPAEQQYIPCA